MFRFLKQNGLFVGLVSWWLTARYQWVELSMVAVDEDGDFVVTWGGNGFSNYGVYAKRIAGSLDPDQIPRHVGVILDGNRRWAKAYGEQASTGHRRGADKIHELLGWCEEVDVEVVVELQEVLHDLQRDVAGHYCRVRERHDRQVGDRDAAGQTL